jgi:hypothetical protein
MHMDRACVAYFTLLYKHKAPPEAVTLPGMQQEPTKIPNPSNKQQANAF